MLIRTVVVAALLVSASVAKAQDCPLPAGANERLGAVDASVRLAYLRAALDRDADSGQAWRMRWIGGYAVIAVGQLLTAPFVTTENQRPGLYVGGVASVIGTIPLIFLPPEVVRDGPEFAAKVKEAGPAATCSLISEGEKLLLRDSKNEAGGVNWLQHVISIVYNGIVAVIIGAGYHNWLSGGLAGGVGALLGEAKILSQPTALTESWKSYQAGAVSGESGPKLQFGAAPGNYMALTATF